MKNILLIAVIIFFFEACSSKQLYTIGDTSHIKSGQKSSQEFIAVERVELPTYLMNSHIYQQDNPYHLKKLDNANWIGEIDKHLTRVIISYLQKSLNNPNIFPYPWSNINHIDKKISITITKFIPYQNVVTLEANYQILDKNKKKTTSYFFNTNEVVSGKNIENMLSAMEKAYFKLIEDINLKL